MPEHSDKSAIEMQSKDSDMKTVKDLDIAIIGMSGRFPGAVTIEQFWHNLRQGVESISRFSSRELEDAGIEAALLKRSNYIKANPILENIDLFDADFFGFSPAEAELTDPQQRIFLECAWEALEAAGYDSESYAGLIGVYTGSVYNNYSFFKLSQAINDGDMGRILIANDKDYLPTRICYKLNLKGPGITVQTACSTSLVATHLACQSLLNYEVDMALAGGIAISLPQKAGYLYQEGAMLSPDGHCRAFDAKAQGTLFGSGAGIVVLKRLEDAIADGDCIHALIKGSAINNDGSLKVSYTAPSVEGQAEAIAEALANAGCNPETISYIETHGTGTPMGDPIEIAALTKAFQSTTRKRGYCAIGSVKTNVGHLNTASGIAGLIKTVLALQHKLLPPSLHFETPNPQIDFENSPFYVNSKLSEWQAKGVPRRAGVSSFGVGGTNAHVILEEAPPQEPSGKSRPWQLLVLSAKTSSALEIAAANLAEHLEQHPELNLADVAYTLSVGRRAWSHRCPIVCQNVDRAVEALNALDSQAYNTRERSVVFIFPGLRVQYQVARELYQSEPIFRKQVDSCSEFLQPLLGLDLRHVLYSNRQEEWVAFSPFPSTISAVQNKAVSESALFAIEYAIAKLWMEWGVHPIAMIGDRIGEFVAATVSGVFSWQDALTLITTRDKPSPAFTQQVNQVSLNLPQIPFISNITGTWITAKQATTPSYWSEDRTAIDFTQSLQALLKEPDRIFLEVGPSGAFPAEQYPEIVSSLPHPQASGSDVALMLTTLGQLWLNGVQVDWSEFYRSERRYRLPLPTYPFERQRYWLDPKLEADDHTAFIGKKPNITDWFYAPLWKPSPPEPFKPQKLAGTSCVLFVNECDLGTQLLNQLEQQGQNAIAVTVGPEFTKLGERAYALNPQQSSDYHTLIEELRSQNALPKTIVHLWNVTSIGETSIAGLDCEVGFYSLLFLVQALGKQSLTDVDIKIVSNNMQPVLGDEVLCPHKATLLGAVKVIPQEYPTISCQSIDIVVPPRGSWQQEKLVHQLLVECTTKSSERVIAYRGLHRWVQIFEPVNLEQTPEKPRLREKGVYLITGGLGGIGLVLAKYLAQTVQAKLILIGRSAIPLREQWDRWLATHSEQDNISRKISKIRELEQLGAEVLAINADVANLEQMQQAIRESQQRFGQIHGVIHAAGVSGGGVMQRKTLEEAARIFAPKVRGTLVLDTILSGIPLDFLVLCSSLTAILETFGQADYAGANAFLDAFAHYKTAIGSSSTRCINWGSWQEVGMAVEAVNANGFSKDFLKQGLLPSEGIEVFNRILASTLPQVVVSPSDLLSLVKQPHTPIAFGQRANSEENSSPPIRPRPESIHECAPRTNETEQKLVRIWQELLGVEPIRINDNFFELNGDSLLATQVASRIRDIFQIELPVNSLYESPTVAGLSKHVDAIAQATQSRIPAGAGVENREVGEL